MEGSLKGGQFLRSNPSSLCAVSHDGTMAAVNIPDEFWTRQVGYPGGFWFNHIEIVPFRCPTFLRIWTLQIWRRCSNMYVTEKGCLPLYCHSSKYCVKRCNCILLWSQLYKREFQQAAEAALHAVAKWDLLAHILMNNTVDPIERRIAKNDAVAALRVIQRAGPAFSVGNETWVLCSKVVLTLIKWNVCFVQYCLLIVFVFLWHSCLQKFVCALQNCWNWAFPIIIIF